MGGRITHFKDFADRDSDRADVNLTNLQYFLFFSLNETTAVGMAPNIICTGSKPAAKGARCRLVSVS